MSLFAGNQVSVEISEALVSPSFSTLKAMRSCRWRLEHAFQETLPVHDDNWAQWPTSSKRSLSISCELYGASHTAQAAIRLAALTGTRLRMRLTLANGTELEGNVQVERYEELANEDGMLEVEANLVSTDVVTVTD